jgi:hypothetical protein
VRREASGPGAGAGVPGVTVLYDYGADDLPDWKTCVTGSGGAFRVAGLFPGRYDLRIDQPGFEVCGVESELPGRPVRMELSPTRVVMFALELPGGLPVTCAAIICEQTRKSQWKCSPNGRYEVEVAESEEEITIDAGRGIARVQVSCEQPGICELGTIVVGGEAARGR